MSTALTLTRLLSRFGDDGCRLLPCDFPRDIRKIRISVIVRIRIRPGKTLKLHFHEGYGVCPTSTTELEPLSDHGAPPPRRIAAAHVALPRASRHFSARQTYVDAPFLNPVSHMSRERRELRMLHWLVALLSPTHTRSRWNRELVRSVKT